MELGDGKLLLINVGQNSFVVMFSALTCSATAQEDSTTPHARPSCRSKASDGMCGGVEAEGQFRAIGVLDGRQRNSIDLLGLGPTQLRYRI